MPTVCRTEQVVMSKAMAKSVTGTTSTAMPAVRSICRAFMAREATRREKNLHLREGFYKELMSAMAKAGLR